MYRCRECQAEYSIKVEYCECGNNTFEYIEDEKKEVPQQPKKQIDRVKQKSELISKGFFAICLIFSVLIILFAGNSTQPKKTKKSTAKKHQVIERKIPNINQIWDDTPIYNPQRQYSEQQTEVINQNTTIPLTSRPVEYPRREQVVTPQTIQKPKKIEQKIPPKVTSAKPDIRQEQQKEEKKVIEKYDPNNPELLEYKSKLRNALFSRLAIGAIQGSGTCIIEFSVNKETGKLENRRFVEQSNNKALNDSIYYMLMSVPRFELPPQSYQGEKFRLKFYLNNGYYEISYI